MKGSPVRVRASASLLKMDHVVVRPRAGFKQSRGRRMIVRCAISAPLEAL
jgi:hypothetical protein